MRTDAAQALRDLGAKARTAVRELTEALADPNEDVFRFAALALGKIGKAGTDAAGQESRFCLGESYARVTERAALSGARWLGRADQGAAEEDASKITEALHLMGFLARDLSDRDAAERVIDFFQRKFLDRVTNEIAALRAEQPDPTDVITRLANEIAELRAGQPDTTEPLARIDTELGAIRAAQFDPGPSLRDLSTAIADLRDGELQAGVLSAPALDERWWGWRGSVG